MEERRQLERFDLAFPTIVEILDSKSGMKGTSFGSLTRDISSHGAFFLMPDPIPVGTRVKADMVLKAEKLHQASGYPQVKATGSVVRTEPTGIAVYFNSRCRFGPGVRV